MTRTARVGDYGSSLTGDLVPGETSPVTATVTRDGEPVTDLQPYLGAYGHLVALREGDLAYLHVHPEESDAGPEIPFLAEVPSDGPLPAVPRLPPRRRRPHRRLHAARGDGHGRWRRTMTTDVELAITGMTCASCANRIERKLNKLDGVVATVNYATEKAKVSFPGIGHAGRPGRHRRAGRVRRRAAASGRRRRPDRRRGPRRRRCGSGCWSRSCSACRSSRWRWCRRWQFDYWQWLSLTLAAPVVVWGAWPFHRAAWVNLRHGTSTMDTLVSVGTLAALGWSVYALFLGTAGEPGMTHPFELTVERSDGAGNIYLEAAAGVTTFILAGRWFEARSKRRAGAALRALLELGAKDVAVLRADGGGEVRIPTDQLVVGDTVRGPPRREDRHRRRGRAGQLRGRRRRC